jgi:hypothetical protein
MAQRSSNSSGDEKISEMAGGGEMAKARPDIFTGGR